MLKTEIARGPQGRVVLLDSITKVTAEDAGSIAVSGSHGGSSSGEFALVLAPLRMAVFNDAGVGKDGAGISALPMLQSHGVAAATVAHTSARIGDALDMWDHGIVSHVNAAAAAMGLQVGEPLSAGLKRLIGAV
jgi:hypothetical protein